MSKFINLKGQRFHRLTVTLKRNERDKWGRVMWECKCDCGSIVYVITGQLRSNKTRSCGCLQREHAHQLKYSHGYSQTREYRIWKGMLGRCYDITHKSYKDYGGRGILVCDEWKNDFEVFLRDMGKSPTLTHTLDRKDNDKWYSKENCRWATKEEQANNTSKSVYYVCQDETLSVSQIARKHGIRDSLLRHRLREGLTLEAAIAAALKAQERSKNV